VEAHAWDLPPAREWQERALDAWTNNRQAGIVEAATGAGKTNLAARCINDFLRPGNRRVLVVVPSIQLQDQWIATLRDIAPDSVDIAPVRRTSTEFGAISVIVVNSTRDGLKAFPSESALLIADECHRMATPSNAAILNRSWMATLGISATPDRSHDEGLSEILVPALGKVVMQYSRGEAIRDGVLVNPRFRNIRIDMSSDIAEQFEAISRRINRLAHGDNEEALKRLLIERSRVINSDPRRVKVGCQVVLEDKRIPTILFLQTIEDCDIACNYLKSKGSSAVAYHSGLSPMLRWDNLRQVQNGIADTIVTCNALDEGADIPRIARAVIAASPSSHRQRIQRVGRVLRIAPGKTESIVVSLYSTQQEEDYLQAEALDLPYESVTWERQG
jgi:superfamily II DNA or RNA helicase